MKEFLQYTGIFILGYIISFYTPIVGDFLFGPGYTVESQECRVASGSIKKAMLKMGPRKRYRIDLDGQLQVLVDGVWLNLEIGE